MTVVADADLEAVESAFGAQPPTDADSEPGEDGAWAWFVHANGVTFVIEENGFQGSRAEVLRPATRRTGRAASVYWNVNGLVRFTCARRGNLTGDIGLDEDPEEADLEELPRAVRRLAALCAYDEDVSVDMVGVGAAMVATFTRISFGADVLELGRPRRLVPPVSDLTGASKWTLHTEPVLRAGIEALSPLGQRAFAAWVARAAIAEAGLQDDPQVAAILVQLGDLERAPTAPRGLDAAVARSARALQARENAAFDDEDLHFDLEGHYATQERLALYIARMLTHEDPLDAALTCADHAVSIYHCSQLERRDLFDEDETGRWRVGQESNPRREAFVDLLGRLARAPRSEWDAALAELPAPLTAEDKADAVRIDHERRDRGDFQTYQVSGADDD